MSGEKLQMAGCQAMGTFRRMLKPVRKKAGPSVASGPEKGNRGL